MNLWRECGGSELLLPSRLARDGYSPAPCGWGDAVERQLTAIWRTCRGRLRTPSHEH